MGLFFAAPQTVLPAVARQTDDCLKRYAAALTDIERERAAANITLHLAKAVSPEFKPLHLAVAVVIAAVLVVAAIWTELHHLHDISKGLMSSFTAFSTLVVGLLAGEAQR